jgi:hypothetical protein
VQIFGTLTQAPSAQRSIVQLLPSEHEFVSSGV